MNNALIFSPSLVGHRQVYVFVIANVLRKLGYSIYIAANFSEKLKSTFYLDKLKTDENVFTIDTCKIDGSGNNISNTELIELQIHYNINQTIFTEADNHISLLNSQVLSGNKRFQGKTTGIFLRPYYFYQKLDFINKLRYIKRLRQIWKSDVRFFHEISNPLFSLLDTSLYIDEYFVSKHKKTEWLPDVFQQYADKLVIDEHSHQREWMNRLDEFKIANKDSFLILYFGTAQHRRGYNTLLKLAFDHDACFIHCGLRTNNIDKNKEADELRTILKSKNRLFETNEYLTDPVCIEHFFKSVSHLILPYIDFYGSSGVMLQALSYNIPVLVPDIGIIGYRVKKHNLGFTYNDDSFEQSFLSFIKSPSQNFSISIEKYMKTQSAEMLESILLNNFIALNSFD